jgi:uncharacterized C2H2 Zn-finger protein
LQAARRAHEVGQQKMVARPCPMCGMLKAQTVKEYERHVERCNRRNFQKAQST